MFGQVRKSTTEKPSPTFYFSISLAITLLAPISSPHHKNCSTTGQGKAPPSVVQRRLLTGGLLFWTEGKMQGYGDGVDPVGDSSTWEIEEVASVDGVSETRQGLSFVGLGERRHAVIGGAGGTPASGGEWGVDVYVAVGKGSSSMDALVWALKQKPSGFVYLVHVFPEVHHIPTPLGKLPRNQVSQQQVETHMSQERSKRGELLQNYLNLCHDSKVKVDTCLIESDIVAKAILELIPVLHITRLIMGTSKSNMRLVKRGSGKIGQVLKDAPEFCEIKIICEGQEVIATADEVASSPSPPNVKEENKRGKGLAKNQDSDKASCNCFSRKFI